MIKICTVNRVLPLAIKHCFNSMDFCSVICHVIVYLITGMQSLTFVTWPTRARSPDLDGRLNSAGGKVCSGDHQINISKLIVIAVNAH